MTNFELLILAISLTFDTFAVSVGGGISMPNLKFSKKAMIMAFFGVFQAAYLFLGWFVGGKFASFIVEWDHWVAFAILTYLGGKMAIGAIKGGEEEETSRKDFLCVKRLAVLATATSIDAMGAGISFKLLSLNPIYPSIIIAIVTFVLSFCGFLITSIFKNLPSRPVEIFGAVLLIYLAIKAILF